MKHKRKPSSSSKEILFILLFSQTVAAFDVSFDVIGQVDNRYTLKCGQSVTFTCSVTPVTDSMNWFINNTIVATCKFGSCAAQSTKPANAVFAYSTSGGIYNLTFIPILQSDDALEYKCLFGSDLKNVTPTVTVFPDESYSGITNSTGSNHINLTASTCVSSSDLVSFKWYLFKTGGSRKLFGTAPTNHMNESSCQSTSNCIGEKSSTMVTIENLEDVKGDYIYFQVEITYTYSSDAEPYRVIINSSTPYKISVEADPSSSSTWDTVCWIIVGVCVFLVVIVILCILSCVQWCCVKPYKELLEKNAKVKYGIENKIACREKMWWKMCCLLMPIYGLCRFYIKKRNLEREKPTDFTYDESCVTNNSFKVKWIPGPDRTNLKFYVVWYLGINEVGNKTITYNTDETIEMECVIENLYPLTIYTVKIQSQIGEWKSAFTNPLTVKTTEKPDKPDMFSFDRDSVTSKSVWLTWEPGTYRGPRHTFTFTLYITKEIEIKKIENIKHDRIDVMRYNLKGLNEATNYTVKISAEYNTMISECETIVNFTTKYEMKTVTEKHQSIAGEDEICCESCKKTGGSNESHAYCLSHALYLCLDCLYKKHKNEKCVLLWNMGKIDRKDHKLCCNKNYNHDDLQLKGVCQNRNLFICSQCIEKNHEHANCTNHQQLRGQLDTKARVCCEQNETNGGTETVGFCKKCKTFICASCSKSHAKHSLISPLTDSPMNDVICKGCASKKKLPIECLALHQGLFLCASCYETGNVNKALKIKNEFRESVVKHLQENQDSCGVHEVLGKVKNSPVEVYCLICKLYMCLGCFKKHRRLYEYWSKTLEGNLFYCNRCPSGEYNPVECCDLTSLEFRCRKCYILNVQSSTRMTYTREVTGKMLHLRDMDSQCQVHEDKTMSPTAAVYCLVCKTTMCKSCFKKHIN